MQHSNIRDYLDCLSKEGELRVIDEIIDPHLELAEIQRRVVARQGPALLFSRVAGTDFPVVTNLFGTRRRLDLAFGDGPSLFIKRIIRAAEEMMAPSLSKLWNYRDLGKQAIRLGTRTRGSGPVLQRSIKPPRLGMLPRIKSWPEDGGAFLTLPLV